MGITSEIVQLDQLKAEPPPERKKHQAADTPETVDPDFECKLSFHLKVLKEACWSPGRRAAGLTTACGLRRLPSCRAGSASWRQIAAGPPPLAAERDPPNLQLNGSGR